MCTKRFHCMQITYWAFRVEDSSNLKAQYVVSWSLYFITYWLSGLRISSTLKAQYVISWKCAGVLQNDGPPWPPS